MGSFQSTLESEVHKKLAIELFNYTWDLIEKSERSEIENEMMVNAAHASRFHWGLVGTPLHIARGEWQISRVYCLVGRAEPALFHAGKSLNVSLANNLENFDIGFAYEAMARAYGLHGDCAQRDENIALAEQSAQGMAENGDRKWLLDNINTVRTLTLPAWEPA